MLQSARGIIEDYRSRKENSVEKCKFDLEAT